MTAMTRRAFWQASSAAALTAAFGPQALPGRKPARIYLVFFGVAPSVDDTHLRPIPHEETVRRLQKECDGVEFVVRDTTQGVTLSSVLNEAKELKSQGYDGVIVYGWPRDYDLLRTGLPTINVAVINDFQNVPYPLFKQNRVAAAFLDPWRFSADTAVSERMFRDLAEKIKLIRTLKRMKDRKSVV